MTTPKKKTNKTLYIVITLILIAIAAFAAQKMGYIGKTEPIKIATEKATKRTIIETISANGKLYPETEWKITPDVSGEIIELTVKEGDSVKKGQLLARINPDIFESTQERAQAAVNIARASEASSQAQIEQARIQVENARRNLERNKQLYADKIIAKVELEATETAYQVAQTQLKAIEKTSRGSSYNIESAQAGLKETQKNIKKTNIYAPANGIISKLSVEKGERVVGTAQFAGTEIMRIANFTTMEVRADVNENDIVRISIGDSTNIELDSYPNREFKGIVTQIASSANGVGGATTAISSLATDQASNFTVKIRLLPNSYTDLVGKATMPFRPGMSASVEIQTEKLQNILTIPIQAVTVREIPDSLKINTKQKPNEIVYTFDNQKNIVLSKIIKTGTQDDRYIQVLQGLTENEEIVSAPYTAISKELKDSLNVKKVKKEELFKKEEE